MNIATIFSGAKFLNTVLLGVTCLSLLFNVSACAGKKVTRVGAEESIDLSGKWNDTDSRLVSEEMIRDSLSWPWITQWEQRYGTQPVVIAYGVSNRSSEHINTKTFVKDLERAFLKSGKVTVVADKSQRLSVREERAEQNTGLTRDPAGIGKELGADFVLTGEVNSINDREGKREIVFYQVNLELINVESNVKSWIGEKKIKKFIKRRRAGL